MKTFYNLFLSTINLDGSYKSETTIFNNGRFIETNMRISDLGGFVLENEIVALETFKNIKELMESEFKFKSNQKVVLELRQSNKYKEGVADFTYASHEFFA